jgi:hypothetical protein
VRGENQHPSFFLELMTPGLDVVSVSVTAISRASGGVSHSLARIGPTTQLRYWRRDRIWGKIAHGELGENTRQLLRALAAPPESDTLLRPAGSGLIEPARLLRSTESQADA